VWARVVGDPKTSVFAETVIQERNLVVIMTYIERPYYKIARPLLTRENEDYLYDYDYAPSRENQISTAFYLEDQIVKLFEYIEPAKENETVYSNKMWQLLVQICTEVESNFKLILSSNGYQETNFQNLNMKNDYYLVNKPMKLHLYKVYLKWHENGECKEKAFEPFAAWSNDYYRQLQWYHSYNNIKHNRFANFKDANLLNVINAFSALRILLYAQFLSYSCSRIRISSITKKEIDALLNEEGCLEESLQYDEDSLLNGSILAFISGFQ
jgi:hypothetical protein